MQDQRKQPFQLITELIELSEEFITQKDEREASLESFILWLNREVLFNESRKHQHGPNKEPENCDHPGDANIKLTHLLLVLSKHFKLYSRKAFVDSDLVSMDGHRFLSTLAHTDSLRKMELINANFSEVPIGIEVIKRLLKKKFIEEFDDPDDKRSKRVRITPHGKEELVKSFPLIHKIVRIMGGRLTEEKKIQLITLLDELNEFHTEMRMSSKDSDLDELLAKVQNVN